MTEIKSYKTSDLPFAAYLYTEGLRILGTAPTEDPKRRVFVFAGEEDNDETLLEQVAELHEKFITGQDTVSASAYFRAMKAVRRFVFDDLGR